MNEKVIHKDVKEFAYKQNAIFIAVATIGMVIFSIFDYIEMNQFWYRFFILRGIFGIFGLAFFFIYKQRRWNDIILIHLFYMAGVSLVAYFASLLTDAQEILIFNLNIALVACYFPAIFIIWNWKNQIIASIYFVMIYMIFFKINSSMTLNQLMVNGGTFMLFSTIAGIFLGYIKGTLINYNISMEKKLIARNEELEKLSKELKVLSITDKLTGLYNRLKIDEEFHSAIANFEGKRPPFSVILIDLDHFKRINDTCGHQVGDEILMQLAKLIKETIKESDFAGRWGGEEFIILCYLTDMKEAVNLAEKLRQKVESYSFLKVGQLTISLGVSEYLSGDMEDTLIRRADNALYKAKESGRNMVLSE